MPIYAYQCSVCSECVDLNKRIADRDTTESDVCSSCNTVGSLGRLLSAPLVGYSISVNGGYGSKVPDGFKEVLKKIHKKAPGSQMDKTSSFM